jgi:hypothetical protein
MELEESRSEDLLAALKQLGILLHNQDKLLEAETLFQQVLLG